MKKTKAPTLEKVGRVTSSSVLKGSGKDWDQWIEILNRAGARHWTHGETAAFLSQRYKLGLWWQQVVTGGYQIVIGVRIEGRDLKGNYSTASSRTLKMDQKALWKFVTSKPGAALWLKPLSPVTFVGGATFETEDGFFGEIRTLKSPGRLRLSWHRDAEEKPTILQVNTVERPNKKSILVIQHTDIKDRRFRDEMCERWKQVMAGISAHFKQQN
jgi:hypothetical protein